MLLPHNFALVQSRAGWQEKRQRGLKTTIFCFKQLFGQRQKSTLLLKRTRGGQVFQQGVRWELARKEGHSEVKWKVTVLSGTDFVLLGTDFFMDLQVAQAGPEVQWKLLSQSVQARQRQSHEGCLRSRAASTGQGLGLTEQSWSLHAGGWTFEHSRVGSPYQSTR